MNQFEKTIVLAVATLVCLTLSACAYESGSDDEWSESEADTGTSEGPGGRDASVDVGPDPSDRQPDRGNVFVYHDPVRDEALQDLAEVIADNMMLEDIAAWLTDNFAFPTDWTLASAQCDQVNAFWYGRELLVVMCHELMVDAVRRFAEGYPDMSPDDISTAAVNTWYFILFHEIGHALVDLWDLPITGGEEDAVDRFATVLLVESGLADTAIYASAWFRVQGANGFDTSELAGQHGLDMQRAYNIICLVYGSSPADYPNIARIPELSQRIDRCPGEYEQAQEAWSRLMEPWTL